MTIKSTKGQREALRKCHPGVGFMAYHKGNGEIVEFDFCIGKDGQPRFVANGQPITFEVVDEDVSSAGDKLNREVGDVASEDFPFDARAMEILVKNDRYLQMMKSDLKDVENVFKVLFNTYVLDGFEFRTAYLEALRSLQQ